MEPSRTSPLPPSGGRWKGALPPVRLLSTDLDGTLLDFRRGVPVAPEFFERVAEARERDNLVWVINTGRWWDSLALEFVERAFPIHPDWLVLTEREIHKLHRGRPVGDYAWNHHCAAAHQKLFLNAEPFWGEVRDFVSSQTGAELLSDAWSPVGIRARNDHEADRIAKFIGSRIAEWPQLSLVRNAVYFRFAHADFHKGSCLAYLQQLLDISPEETLAAGDHYNDLPMLDRAYARRLVCPANAIPEVKERVSGQDGHVASAPYSAGVVEGWDALAGGAGHASPDAAERDTLPA